MTARFAFSAAVALWAYSHDLMSQVAANQQVSTAETNRLEIMSIRSKDRRVVFEYAAKQEFAIERVIRDLKAAKVQRVRLHFETKFKPEKILQISNALNEASIAIDGVRIVSGATTRRDAPDAPQLLGTIVPLVRGYGPRTNISAPLDVVIVTNAPARSKLSADYSKLNDSLKFENEDGVFFDGQAYVHKPSKTRSYVSTFVVISRDRDQCVVEWNRVISSVGGTTKTVTMRLVDGKWKVTEIKLKSVS